MYGHAFSKLAIHQIRHEATHKVNCKPGGCIWSRIFLSCLCGGNILSLAPPIELFVKDSIDEFANCYRSTVGKQDSESEIKILDFITASVS